MITAEPTVFVMLTLFDEGLLQMIPKEEQILLVRGTAEYVGAATSPFIAKVQDRTLHWLEGVLYKLKDKGTVSLNITSQADRQEGGGREKGGPRDAELRAMSLAPALHVACHFST